MSSGFYFSFFMKLVFICLGKHECLWVILFYFIFFYEVGLIKLRL